MRGTLARRVVIALSVAGAVSLTAPVALPAGAGEAGSAEPAVTGAVQVTRNPQTVRSHSSPQMARNPVNGELVIVESDVRGSMACNVHISRDGGASWFPGGSPALEPWTECSRKTINGPYATLAFDREGVLYVAFMASDPQYAQAEELPIHIFLARSADGGRTFETSFVHRAPEPVEADEGLHNNDRPMMAVDLQNPDNVYVAWMQRGAEGEKTTKALVAASRDGGRTFQDAVDVTDERGGYQPRPAVAPDGTLHVIYPIGLDARPEGVAPFEVVRTLYHRRSSDRGRTWSEPVEVDQGNAGFYGGRKFVLAADQNDGTLYAVWYGNADPLFDPLEEGVDVFLRSSRDGGRTWSERVTVNDDAGAGRVNHYDPGIAIAPNGRLDIAWYDFRNSPYPERFPEGFGAPFNHGGYQDVYYAWSQDGGRTFAPNVRVTDRIINREIGVWSNNVHSHMSVAIASTNERVYLAWQDTRNGTSDTDAEDIYMAGVVHPGAGSGLTAGSDRIAWSLLGGGVALALGGLVLIVGTRYARRTQPELAAAPVSRSGGGGRR